VAIRFPESRLAAEVAAKADQTPTVIPAGKTFRVPAGAQHLYSQAIELEGDAVIQIDGVLIEVD
jgi:hypothetical protein